MGESGRLVGRIGLPRELPSVGQVPNHLNHPNNAKHYVALLFSNSHLVLASLQSPSTLMAVLDSEQSMFSDDDDDMPLASQSSNGITTNGHVATNGIGNGKGRVLDADGDTPMSDVDDDDVPLVGIPPETCTG